MSENLHKGYTPVFRDDLGDGVWLVGFRSLYRQTATIGIEMAEERRHDDRAAFRRLIREKMQALGDRLLEAWDQAEDHDTE